MACVHSRRVSGLILAAGAASTLLAMVPAALAQTWNGASATTNNFNDGTNWVGGIAPVNNGTANLIFGGVTRLSPVVNVVYDVNGITFNNTAGAFSIGGGLSLSVRSGGITNNDFTSQTFTCPVVVNAFQNWSPASGGLTFSGSITLNAPLTLNVPTNSVTLTNATILGSGSLTKSGNSSATIGNSSYSGPTVVTGGTLFSGGANFLSDSSHVQLTGTGTLSLQNNSDTIPSLTSNTGTIVDIGSGTLTLAANDSNTYTHGGIIQGTGNVIKTGSHTAIFAASNTYTGTTTVSNGTLRISGSERLANTSSLTIAGGVVELSGATETVNSVSMTAGSLGEIGNPGGTLAASSFGLQAGTIYTNLSGSMTLTKTGSGTGTLSSSGNSFGGGVNVSGGTLVTNAPDAIPDFATVNIGGSGTWQLSAVPETVSSITGSGSILLTNSTLTLGASNGSPTFTGVISDNVSASNVTKIGTGTWFVYGNNTYRGTTTLNAGSIYLVTPERLADNSSVVVNAGTFSVEDETVNQFTINGGAVTQNSSGGQLRASVINLNAGIVDLPLVGDIGSKGTTGTVYLNQPNTFQLFFIDNGVLEIYADAALGAVGSAVTCNGGSLRIVTPMTLNRPMITGGGMTLDCQADVVLRDYRQNSTNSGHGLIKNGPGTLTLNCTTAYTGFMTINTGSVRIDAASSVPINGLTTFAGSILDIDGGLVRILGSGSIAGSTVLSDGGRLSGGALTNSGILEGSGTVSTTLTNAAAGDIRIGAGQSIDFTSATATSNSGLIDVIGGSAEFTARVNNQASTGLIFARNADLRFNGGLTNFGGMAISFGTTDVFGDVDNRSGATITVSGAGNATFIDDVINNGSLRTSSGGNSVFLGSVSGSGTFPGTGTVYLEGDLRPGNSPGLMNFGGDVVLGTFCSTVQEIAGTDPSQFDRIQVGQQIEVDGSLNVQLLGGFQPAALQTFPIITSNGLTGRFTSVTIPSTTPALHLKYTTTAAILTTCLADFNNDAVVDFFDYLDFVAAFSTQDVSGDFNLDEVIDFFDYLDFVAAFSTGC